MASGQGKQVGEVTSLRLHRNADQDWIVALKARYFTSSCHLERVRNASAASNYCQNFDTRVEGPFTFGEDLRRTTIKRSAATSGAASKMSRLDTAEKASLPEAADVDLLQELVASGFTKFDIAMKFSKLFENYSKELDFVIANNSAIG